MATYFLKRIVSMVVTIILITIIAFSMMHTIPGGPFTRERPVPPEILRALEAKYNLDDPLPIQYLNYMKGLVTFDLGPSYSKVGTTVNELITSGFPSSAKIGLLATLLIVGLGVPIGVISALKQNSKLDYFVMIIATLGITVPNFVIGTAIIYFFSGKLGWLPGFGLNSPLAYIGPVIALSGYSLSFISRLTRSSMLEVLRQDYIRTARANGIKEFSVIARHAVKNGLIPVVTYIGPMIATILTGSFVVERVFAVPGLGRHFVESITNRDYTTIMGVTVFYAAFYMIMVLLVDIAYVIIDPRIKFGEDK
ncbi:ABC transporter permease [Alkaliphilus serpentinus]|uniref:ABC transporter permease n=1 Tax=Alkaliphilus serpentinus TaxID=1482731 RepID=A0A833HMH5_9FIRM|nr:ABC transporter permease [Alkaliphilus serpentinus]KAB3527605.1 ABC transporter permease [Alkaliphilus serpentinus]